MERKLKQLNDLLKELGSVLIAYSGGVDSTFLAVAAHRALGERVLAVTASSPTYPQSEIEAAKNLASQLGIRHLVIETDELADSSFVANDTNRCYYCKKELFNRLQQLAVQENMAWVVDGSNLDDLKDYRPGRRAAAEFGVRSPLCEVGLTKQEIRVLSHRWGLPTWDKPSLACLASRFPYGSPITIEVLTRISQAEAYLRQFGVKQVRVRHHDHVARIEVEQQDMALFLEESLRLRIVEKLRSLGYTYITLDLAGFRSGSMNEIVNRDRTPI